MRHNRCRRFGSVVVLGLLLLPAVTVFAADMVTVPLFPGEVFYRDTGAPFAVTRTFTVPATEGTFVLRLVNGDGATEEAVSFAYTAPGTYRATVTATDAAGQTYMAEKTIVVQERQAVDTLLSGRWHGLSLSLEAQDLQGGLAHLLPESRAKYQAIFSPLAAQLPTVFASISLPELIRVTGNVAQYRVRREQMWQGAVRTITYYVWFVKDQDGVWRIDAF
ncbi:MAG: PKD domain-containing protein [Desulfobacteria bacterium]|nr:hypothetical protein [Deltaproteobacteria bacterium]